MHCFPRLISCAAVAVVATCAASARGAISWYFTPVPISAATIAEDPALAGMERWDIGVTTNGDWASAGMRMVMHAGQNFYNHPLGGNTRPSSALVAAFPALAYDTYVTSPSDIANGAAAPAILGGYPEGTPLSMSGERIAVSWGDLVVDAPGTYPIMRFTFPRGRLASFSGVASQVNPASDITIMGFPPEPAALGLGATAVALLLTRARARSPQSVRE